MQLSEIIARLEAEAHPENLEGMARFGIGTTNAYGISLPTLRALGKEIGKDHSLAQELWATGNREARILATLVDDPKQVTEEQMESWVGDFDSWEICDQCCGNLFERTPFAYAKALEWSGREEEFVKRAGFVLVTQIAVHDKKRADEPFLDFLPVIKREAHDGRNFVKKAVNWALREIGKRNVRLNAAAIEAAREIRAMGSKPARWIASDTLRELESEVVQARLRR